MHVTSCLRAHCNGLSRADAEREYGQDYFMGDAGIVYVNSGVLQANCDRAGFGRVFAVLVKTPGREFLISDVNGHVFLQEIKE